MRTLRRALARHLIRVAMWITPDEPAIIVVGRGGAGGSGGTGVWSGGGGHGGGVVVGRGGGALL